MNFLEKYNLKAQNRFGLTLVKVQDIAGIIYDLELKATETKYELNSTYDELDKQAEILCNLRKQVDDYGFTNECILGQLRRQTTSLFYTSLANAILAGINLALAYYITH